jgi:Flp pilus assembly protein TadD
VGPVPARRGVVAGFVGVAFAFALGGCFATDHAHPDVDEGVPPITTDTVQRDADVEYYPSDDPLRLALEHFNRGDFGIAERYFRDAVEKAPKDASAWVGLAASEDRLGRFDLADPAYAQAARLAGETTALLNNRGYSYMLRGDLIKARKDFLKAYEREPTNPIIVNNLKLLDGSARFIKRSPGVFEGPASSPPSPGK